jgi:hypothetical protein
LCTMYGQEKQVRKQFRLKQSVIDAAKDLCKHENRNFTNLIETLILREHKSLGLGK